jgi:hypothetical protein
MPDTTPPPPLPARPPFSLTAYRAFNDALEARQRAPEVTLRRARADLDAVLSMLAARDERRGRR